MWVPVLFSADRSCRCCVFCVFCVFCGFCGFCLLCPLCPLCLLRSSNQLLPSLSFRRSFLLFPVSTKRCALFAAVALETRAAIWPKTGLAEPTNSEEEKKKNLKRWLSSAQTRQAQVPDAPKTTPARSAPGTGTRGNAKAQGCKRQQF